MMALVTRNCNSNYSLGEQMMRVKINSNLRPQTQGKNTNFAQHSSANSSTNEAKLFISFKKVKNKSGNQNLSEIVEKEYKNPQGSL